MADKRQRCLSEFKAKVILAALKEYKILVKLSRYFGVSTVQIGQKRGPTSLTELAIHKYLRAFSQATSGGLYRKP